SIRYYCTVELKTRIWKVKQFVLMSFRLSILTDLIEQPSTSPVGYVSAIRCACECRTFERSEKSRSGTPGQKDMRRRPHGCDSRPHLPSWSSSWLSRS